MNRQHSSSTFAAGFLTSLLSLCLACSAFAWTPGTNALRFDGANDYITFGTATNLGLSTFTLECWFMREGAGVTTSTGTGGTTAIPLITKGRGENDGGVTNCNYFFGISNNVLVADFEEATPGTNPGLNHPVWGSTAISTNVWYHGAVTYDGTNWALYLNGVPETNLFVGRTPEFKSIQHAALASALTTSGAAAGFFKGVLDEVRIWNRALTGTQISNNMNLEITNAANLVARWGLNEDAGTSAFDSTGNGVTGTLINGPAWIPAVTNVTRGPYLQTGTATNIIVRWRTDFPTDSVVRFGSTTNNLALAVTNSTVTTEHEVLVGGLTPQTKYFYSIGTSTATLTASDSNQYFITSPVPGTPKPTRIWAIGDFGFGTAAQAQVRDAYYNFNGTNHTDVWLMLGDNAYNSGTDSEYQTGVFDVYTSLFRKAVPWPTLGNHDTGGTNVFTNNYPYFDIFTLPKNGESGGMASGTEHYYSFDYGNIHFICLDSMTANRGSNADMAIWLQGDLAETTNRWLIAYWHHPAYTKGSHNSDTATESIEMRQNILPILEAGGVDLVLAGHSHVYERSYFIDGHYGPSTNFNTNSMIVIPGDGRQTNGVGGYGKPRGLPAHKGTVYTVMGSSGATGGFIGTHPAMVVSLNNLGSLVLDVDGDRLDATFLRETGAINDTFTIFKTNTPPAVSNLVVNIPADSVTNLFISASDLNHDALTFQPDALPQHGLLSNLNPTNGVFTYTPAHGFTGSGSFTFLVSDGITNAQLTVTLNVLPLPDTNGNQLPDAWEIAYSITNPNTDSDGDGFSNLQEYFAFTDPTSTLSSLQTPAVTRNALGQFIVTWNSIGSVRYRVMFSDGAASGDYNGVFTEIVRSVTAEMDSAPIGTPSTQTFVDDFTLTGGSPANGKRYYRVEVVR